MPALMIQSHIGRNPISGCVAREMTTYMAPERGNELA